MGKNHGAKQQKKIAKHKAKRTAKRFSIFRRSSNDPTVRLKGAGKWPVVQSLVGEELWNDGIGYLIIARQESEGQLIFAVFLVDVYCLGVKNAFWRAGTTGELKDMIRKMEQTQTMTTIAPECLVKIVKGAVEYAQSFGFPAHPDYRHAAMLLAGIDPETCSQEFSFGRDGKPFYIQGPNESLAQALAIRQRIVGEGGHYIVGGPGVRFGDLAGLEADYDESDSLDEDD